METQALEVPLGSHIILDIENFSCPCGCGRADMDQEFLDRLSRAMQISGCRYKIIVGFRCPTYNRLTGGAPSSPHLDGLAAKISIADGDGRHRGRILFGLIKAGFRRIGIAWNHIHVDSAKGGRSEVWLI